MYIDSHFSVYSKKTSSISLELLRPVRVVHVCRGVHLGFLSLSLIFISFLLTRSVSLIVGRSLNIYYFIYFILLFLFHFESNQKGGEEKKDSAQVGKFLLVLVGGVLSSSSSPFSYFSLSHSFLNIFVSSQLLPRKKMVGEKDFLSLSIQDVTMDGFFLAALHVKRNDCYVSGE